MWICGAQGYENMKGRTIGVNFAGGLRSQNSLIGALPQLHLLKIELTFGRLYSESLVGCVIALIPTSWLTFRYNAF